MAIEEGLVRLIQGRLEEHGVTVPGGFASQASKDVVSALSASSRVWTYRVVTARPELVLAGRTSWTEMYIQIDCHGATMADAFELARAVDRVLLNVTRIRLADAEETFVDSILLEDKNDGYVDASRSFVRSLDYRVNYHQQ